MSIDWSQISVDHVRQACDLYDTGAAVPKRPAKSTFLLLNGNSYPAKFIRGLAYRIATGVELDPNKDFAGGNETAHFFSGLGLQTSSSATVVPSPPASPLTPVAKATAPLAISTPVTNQPVKQAAGEIKKIALVAHDYNVPDCRGLYDYSEHFARINKLCDDQGCDTILYALFTWDSTSPVAKTHGSIFKGLEHVQRIILEVGKPTDSCDHVEVWVRDQQKPLLAYQRFATSTSSAADKQRFLDDLPSRQIGTALLVVCGESNIASLVRGSEDFYGPFEFAVRLREMQTRVVLNPVHDYMRRYEMREKRRYFSQNARTVVSVWNQGKGKEAWLPWTVFHDGEERTDRVQEMETPFTERPDIRIGVFDMNNQ